MSVLRMEWIQRLIMMESMGNKSPGVMEMLGVEKNLKDSLN